MICRFSHIRIADIKFRMPNVSFICRDSTKEMQAFLRIRWSKIWWFDGKYLSLQQIIRYGDVSTSRLHQQVGCF